MPTPITRLCFACFALLLPLPLPLVHTRINSNTGTLNVYCLIPSFVYMILVAAVGAVI